LRALMSRRREVSRRHGKTLEEVHENAIPVFQTGRKDLLPILEGLHRDPFFALFSIFIACGFWFTDLRELVYIIAARYVWELWITFRTDSVLKSELAEWQKKENVACEYEIAACKDSSAETGRACIRHTFDFLRSWSEVHPK